MQTRQNPAGLFVFKRAAVEAGEFVRYWAQFYDYPSDDVYSRNICGPATPASLKELFEWKVGKRFFAKHWPDIEQRFVSRLSEALAWADDISAQQALEAFDTGGVVYRIFWLHCIQPNRFPIYDQHVHRAMNVIEGMPDRELSVSTKKSQIRSYIHRYLPFLESRFAGIQPRETDRALWAFGKFMKAKRDTPFARNNEQMASNLPIPKL